MLQLLPPRRGSGPRAVRVRGQGCSSNSSPSSSNSGGEDLATVLRLQPAASAAAAAAGSTPSKDHFFDKQFSQPPDGRVTADFTPFP